ncbi:MAG: AmmeMemoRadiSam system protein B [Candidatus Aegiribacteria sp.]|nr:AmmeMemoRadiSam system protein B [Candidatus Aegiribacteria sp.]MBD3294028.1 AmmeMemoRadiSam system protein B [Candidatus Fermentibacteria bacterium]
MRVLAASVLFLAACGGSSPSQDTTSMDAGNETIRPSAVAGMFYPADPGALSTMVDSLLAISETPSRPGIVAGVVPHAGYVYSGATASDFYVSLEDEEFDLVVIAGPSHQVRFDGFSLYEGNAYSTPLGEVQVAEDVVRRLQASHPSAAFVPEAHESEHSIEVQLPFLQRVLQPGFEIVPVVVGNVEHQQIGYLAELILAEAYGRRILVIASSDLSHYPTLELAESVDSTTVEAILEGDVQEFLNRTSPENLPSGLGTFTCGRLPIALIMAYAGFYPDMEQKLLSMTTSADFSEDESRVVGYASIAFGSGQPAPSLWEVSENGRTLLLEIARSSVHSAVTGAEYTPPGELPEELTLPRGAFVTLKKNGELRGCIGSIRPVDPLADCIAQVARSAAVEDPRFIPVSETELEDLEYEISVLTPLQIMEDWREVRVGTDGLVIIGDGGRSGVLLPQVPLEQGWNREDFLEGLCRKAGLPSDAYLEDVILYRFQAQILREDDGPRREEG